MSFSADIEHLWTDKDHLPATLHKIFERGVCCVFTDEQFTAAIPASNEEAAELADLFEIAAVALVKDDPAMKAYYLLRDRLCGQLGYQQLSLLFIQEMEKQKEREESPRAKYLKLASAARNN